MKITKLVPPPIAPLLLLGTGLDYEGYVAQQMAATGDDGYAVHAATQRASDAYVREMQRRWAQLADQLTLVMDAMRDAFGRAIDAFAGLFRTLQPVMRRAMSPYDREPNRRIARQLAILERRASRRARRERRWMAAHALA